jgi:ribosome-binding factor A
MKTNTRITRVNDEILRETAEIIRSELKDPRVGAIVSVLRAETSADLRHCKIYVSILGDPGQQMETMQGLQNAASFIRKCLAERINLRNTPEMRFIFDDSMEYGFKMYKLIEKANQPVKEAEI